MIFLNTRTENNIIHNYFEKGRLIEMRSKKQNSWNLDEKSLEIVQKYCEDDLRLLKKVCDPIILLKNVPQWQYDDLYDNAMEVLLESVSTYQHNKDCSFHTYLTGNIKRSFYDWTRDNTRWKRCNLLTDKDGKLVRDEKGDTIVVNNKSLDETNEDGNNIYEKVDSGFDLESEIFKNSNNTYMMGNASKYLKSFGKDSLERKIAELVIQNYSLEEIKEDLKIPDKKFNALLAHMRTFEKQVILKYKEKSTTIKEEDKIMSITMQTYEKSKPDKMSIASIIKKIDNYTIRFDHPLQRSSDQWNPTMKGNMISDILQRNPLPSLTFAEQIINGISIIWDLDGKQRCTNAYDFYNNKFKISKNVRRWNISYQAKIKDENGKPVLDSNGFPMSERREFDIRNKYFSDLPEELQDVFVDYNFEIVQYFNCSSEDIAYHIERYNDGRPMTKPQKGIIKLGEDFASIVKSISSMPFFKEHGNYTVSAANNGTINRIVVESIMATNFIEDWNKEQSEICEFIKNHATPEMFDNFEDVVNRITESGNEDAFEMFNARDSFIWFGLFGRFVKLEKEDKEFFEFMAEFSQSLHSKVINGRSYDEVCIDKENGKTKSTKDKQIVIQKMSVLEDLMYEYFGINKECYVSSDVIDPEIFIAENVGLEIHDVKNDMDCYEETLTNLESNCVRDGSKLLDIANRLSLLAMVAYSYKNDIDLDEWLEEYAANNNTYFMDQRKNYSYMVNDFNQYQKRIAVA